MLHNLANGGFVALKRAAEDGDTERKDVKNLLYSRRLLRMRFSHSYDNLYLGSTFLGHECKICYHLLSVDVVLLESMQHTLPVRNREFFCLQHSSFIL